MVSASLAEPTRIWPKSPDRLDSGLEHLTAGTKALPPPAEPGVILDPFATDFPEPITTRIYRADHVKAQGVDLNGREVILFPEKHTIDQIVAAYRRILQGTGIQAGTTPKNVEARTPAVKVEYGPKYSPLGITKEGMTILNAAVEMLARQFNGVRSTYTQHIA